MKPAIVKAVRAYVLEQEWKSLARRTARASPP